MSGEERIETVGRAGPPTFATFYDTHRERLYRALALTIRDPDLAREAVDEAMARAAQRWATIHDYDAPAGWVFRVALNWSRSVFRRRSHLWRANRPHAVPDSLPDVDVNRAVAGLPEHQRVVVVARFYLDWTIDDIAAALEIPPGTVKSRLSRALSTLAETLGSDS